MFVFSLSGPGVNPTPAEAKPSGRCFELPGGPVFDVAR